MFNIYSGYTIAYSDICSKLLQLRKDNPEFDKFTAVCKFWFPLSSL